MNDATDNLILDKLQSLEGKVDNIENAIALMAVQDQKILNMQDQIASLWKKYDDAFAPDGIVTVIAHFQAACPKEELYAASNRQWAAISLLGMMVVGTFLKILGVF